MWSSIPLEQVSIDYDKSFPLIVISLTKCPVVCLVAVYHLSYFCVCIELTSDRHVSSQPQTHHKCPGLLLKHFI